MSTRHELGQPRTSSHRTWRVCLAATVVVGVACVWGAVPIAQAPRWRAYVTNFDGDGISVVDLTTRSAVASVKTGRKPHGVAVAPDGSSVFVSNEADGTLSIIDPQDHHVRATVAVGGAPHQLEVTRDSRFVLIPLNDKAAVAVYDVRAGAVVRTIPVGRGPHIVRHQPGSDQYLVTSEGDAKLVFLDAATWQTTADTAMFGQPRVPAYTPGANRAYQTLRWLNGALVVDVATHRVTDRIVLKDTPFAVDGKDAHGVAVTPDGAEVWLATQTTDAVTIVSTRTHEVLGQVPVGRDPNWIEFTGDGALAVVSNTGGNSVTLIDAREVRRGRGSDDVRVEVPRAPQPDDDHSLPEHYRPRSTPGDREARSREEEAAPACKRLANRRPASIRHIRVFRKTSVFQILDFIDVRCWCGRGDSNPHGIATASPSSWCVCQFRHFRKWWVPVWAHAKIGTARIPQPAGTGRVETTAAAAASTARPARCRERSSGPREPRACSRPEPAPTGAPPGSLPAQPPGPSCRPARNSDHAGPAPPGPGRPP